MGAPGQMSVGQMQAAGAFGTPGPSLGGAAGNAQPQIEGLLAKLNGMMPEPALGEITKTLDVVGERASGVKLEGVGIEKAMPPFGMTSQLKDVASYNATGAAFVLSKTSGLNAIPGQGQGHGM